MSDDEDRRGGSEHDRSAAEREARRLERERRRAEREAEQRGEGARRSLGARVGAGSEPASEEPGSPAEPEPDSREFFRVSSTGADDYAARRQAGAEILRRRLIAAAAVIGLLVVIVLVVKAAGGSDEEPDQVASEPTVEVQDLTVPEGLTRAEIGKVAKKAKLRGSYAKASKRAPKGFDLERYGAGDAPSLEGFLFPATYELRRRAPAQDLVNKQLDAFQQNIAEVDLRKAKRKNLTTYDVLKIASMIEREVAIPEERRLVSAVIHNRLADGEPLAIDATLRYELDDFDSPLLESELAADTPYNSRLNAGLPPTPIGNPGLASIEAAADPADKDFRYYVIKPGTCNEHFFTADAAEFEQAQAEYQAALEAEGGSPTDCD